MNILIYGRLTCFSFNDSDILCWAVPIFCFWGNEQYLSFASHTRLAMFLLMVKRNKEWLFWQMTERAFHHPLPPPFPLNLSTGHQIRMARLIFLLSNKSVCKWEQKILRCYLLTYGNSACALNASSNFFFFLRLRMTNFVAFGMPYVKMYVIYFHVCICIHQRCFCVILCWLYS